ncbi:MAG: CsbD family protein [Bacteriovorax sp.]|nr:CsbD family protein [Bacteriovorax sp.]
MDTQIGKGNINELKGQIKQMWGKLTDDDLTRLEGGGEEIVGKVQKAYGYTKERAQLEFDKFKSNNSQFFRDNRESNNKENTMASTQYDGQMDVNKMKNRAQHILEEDIVEPAQEYLSKAREFGSKAVEKGSDLVKENPGYTILGAAAVGFLAGAYFSRRR